MLLFNNVVEFDLKSKCISVNLAQRNSCMNREVIVLVVLSYAIGKASHRNLNFYKSSNYNQQGNVKQNFDHQR